jgi:hypothetical protein
VFAVVEHEQQVAVTNELQQRVGDRPPRLIRQPEHTRDCDGHDGSVCDRRQVDVPNSVGELLRHPARNLDG